ncbi:hypothetical protein ABT173_15370 [Streptomyces sp. NPDC001795]|uniref:hypothetical protein n=1 Tax=unclassified Streptomyces TaxID=2593676 RepID=UPI0033205109
MLRHEFQPGRLIAGVALATAGALYLGDAAGAWETPWFGILPVVNGGLCLAAVTGLLTRAIRKGRSARREQHAERDEVAAP